MNKALTNKILEGFCNQSPSLIDFSACHLTPKFESELQIKEYEQALIDVHKSDDRRNLIHSKKGLEIVRLYMKVWQIPAHQAMRELINDDAYTCYICPLRVVRPFRRQSMSTYGRPSLQRTCHWRASRRSSSPNVFFRRPVKVKVGDISVCTGETWVDLKSDQVPE